MPDTLPALHAHYPAPSERACRKTIDHLDVHCRRFIGLSPFVVLATHNAAGAADASPRGGAPGFVHVCDNHTLWLPDASGNNLLDSLGNIVETGEVGMLFFIPGVDELLRINGTARLRADEPALAPFAHERHRPRMVVEVVVTEAYLHCAKALMRADLWNPKAQVERSTLPSMGEMLKDHTGLDTPPESQADMLARYRKVL